MPLDFLSLLLGRTRLPEAEARPPTQRPQYPCEAGAYERFGPIDKVRRIRFHPIIIGIKGPEAVIFDPDTKELQQVYYLAGARISALDGKEFVLTGPYLGGPWLLRAANAREARDWSTAFEAAADTARALLRAANRSSEAECSAEYRQWVKDVIATTKATAASAAPPSRRQMMALTCRSCGLEYHPDTRVPSLLQCHHTFCQPCIQKLAQGGHAACPSCGSDTPLPDGGATQLPKNFALMEVKGAHHMWYGRGDLVHILDSAGGTCPICFDALLSKVPLVLQCGHSMCDECAYGVAVRGKDGAMVCPECRASTDLKAGLGVNHAMHEAVLEIIRLSQEASSAGRVAAQRRWAALRWTVAAVFALVAIAKEKKKLRMAKPAPKGRPLAGSKRLPAGKPSPSPVTPKRAPPVPKRAPASTPPLSRSTSGPVVQRPSSQSAQKKPAPSTPRPTSAQRSEVASRPKLPGTPKPAAS